jgi:hypothetical protein
MEPHSTVEAPQKESSNRLLHVLSGIIALVTLALPLYITAHYSSSNVTNSSVTNSIPTITSTSPTASSNSSGL